MKFAPFLALTLLLLARQSVGFTAEPLQFNRDIRPILSDKCFACHGFDAKTREANLRLDIADGAYGSGESGKVAIKPKELVASEVWKRINATDDSHMPPAESNKKLTQEELATLKRWIEEGAGYQKHWAFEPPTAAALPDRVKLKLDSTNPIDAFLAERLNREGLRFSPVADKATLIRRVSFALTGLPPTTADLEMFLSDTSPEAYEKLLDRYLASPQYGEEMARHWLDLARYADTHGLHLDNERQMWAYRDWVINSFNRNQSYDRFTVEQIAGDLLPYPTNEQLTATGFNRCNVTTGEGGNINEESLYRYAIDRTSTTVQTWLGLTAGCAQCHDHKFDPISQREFYSLYAFFNSAADPGSDGNTLITAPSIKLETPEAATNRQAILAKIEAQEQVINEQAAAVQYTDPATTVPAPATKQIETVWLEDNFPGGGRIQRAGHDTTFVTAETGKVYSGERALKRTDDGLAQDVFEKANPPLEIPQNGKLFAYIYLDPANPPKSVMLQYNTGGWNHRAVWGDYDIIPWGAVNTPERVSMGPLPATGEWVRLEVPAEKLGLKPSDRISGFACTQYGGTVYWDKVGISGESNPATDPLRSFQAWWKQAEGKNTPDLPLDLAPVAKNGPDKKTTLELERRLRAYYLSRICADTKPRFETSVAELAKLRAERDTLDKNVPGTFIYKDLPNPRDSFVMKRGLYNQPGEAVEPGVPAALPALKPNDGKRATRLDLANWLVSPAQPLTTRVAVNRFWQQFFGTGLVKSSSDFGSQGEVPSHPELLDWLALHFQHNGWDVKKLTKLMLMSDAFRQSSRITPELLAKDPENRLYGRGPRFRLDAEQIRDNALFVSGLLKQELGGKGVKPYQPANIWEPVGFVGSNTRSYKQDSGDSLYRRSIYTFFKRTAPPPFMVNFDAPNREQICARRERSNTPLQALQLLNDVQHIEAARTFAERMLVEGGAKPEERLAFAYRNLLARLPENKETTIVLAELEQHLQRYRADATAAKELIQQGQAKPNEKLDPSELAAYTLIANMLLNLDETVNRN